MAKHGCSTSPIKKETPGLTRAGDFLAQFSGNFERNKHQDGGNIEEDDKDIRTDIGEVGTGGNEQLRIKYGCTGEIDGK